MSWKTTRGSVKDSSRRVSASWAALFWLKSVQFRSPRFVSSRASSKSRDVRFAISLRKRATDHRRQISRQEDMVGSPSLPRGIEFRRDVAWDRNGVTKLDRGNNTVIAYDNWAASTRDNEGKFELSDAKVSKSRLS